MRRSNHSPILVRATALAAPDAPATGAAQAVDGLTVSGTLLVYNRASRVTDPGKPPYDEKFAPGSFRQTIAAHPNGWPAFSMHGWRHRRAVVKLRLRKRDYATAQDLVSAMRVTFEQEAASMRSQVAQAEAKCNLMRVERDRLAALLADELRKTPA